MFSRRTQWDASSNRLTELLEARRSSGRRVIDLTVSNPTVCGFAYPGDRILSALSTPASLEYRPDPRGLLSAREAISAYYLSRGLDVHTDDIFITASTSESYSLLLRLLCNPADRIVAPTPSYPLIEYLAGINDVQTEYYRLVRGSRWTIDMGSLEKALRRSPRAVLAVDPHNPTGMFLTADERRNLSDTAARHGAALIVDEVFTDYRLPTDFPGGSAAGSPPAQTPGGGLTFLLNGLSKMAALPQLKLGWIAIRGENRLVAGARSRLEFMNDIYLSANTPAQAALPRLLEAGADVRGEILGRIGTNLQLLRATLDGVNGCSVLPCEGGWNAIVRLPGGITDEASAERLLDEAGVYCYPGYFFEFEEDDVVIISLLPPAAEFQEGIEAMAEWIGANAGQPI